MLLVYHVFVARRLNLGLFLEPATEGELRVFVLYLNAGGRWARKQLEKLSQEMLPSGQVAVKRELAGGNGLWLETSGTRKHLQELIDDWLQNGRQFSEEWRAQVDQAFEDARIQVIGDRLQLAWRLPPLRELSARRIENPKLQLRGPYSWRVLRARVAVALELSRHAERLGKCDRCARYYFAKTRHGNTRYCSRSCHDSAGAQRATRKQRAAERRRKLDAAQDAVGRMPVRSAEDWKGWVVRHARPRGTRLTLNFLTSAVKRGELSPPVPKGKSNAQDSR